MINSSQDEIVEITPEVMKKELEPEKEKPASSRSRCLRSSAPGRSRKKKGDKEAQGSNPGYDGGRNLLL